MAESSAHAHKTLVLSAPSGGVQIVICRECQDWRIVLARGEGIDDLVVEMDDVGERLVGPTRNELLSLAATLRAAKCAGPPCAGSDDRSGTAAS